MCYFVCLALPRKNIQCWSTIPHGFEVADVTDWSIGKATCGNQDRDSAFLVTSGGCSCFISDGNHRSTKATLDEFKSFIRSLLQETHYVSLLIHYASGDISKEEVIRKDKKSILLEEVSDQLNQLELDVRYINAQQTATSKDG
ncbi:MAG TPA: hypothetical protein VHS05_25525 [Pyrinomonadaceae bacterium]|jgi:hypothetical protein|nr:hypothetical protein [Pyrinomonadaceae bacterium]